MRNTAFDFDQEISRLLNGLIIHSSTKLGRELRDDSGFCQMVQSRISELWLCYTDKQGEFPQARDIFEQRVRRWLKTPPDSYISFVGELYVANQLRLWGVPHSFIPETKHKTPDIEFVLAGEKVFVEVATIQENSYFEFCKKVQERFRSKHPGRDVDTMVGEDPDKNHNDIGLINGQEEALVDRAVQEIECEMRRGGSQAHYAGEYGRFTLVFRESPTASGITWSWPEARVQNDLPWFESKLKETLARKHDQLTVCTPTFLAWVNTDKSCSDIAQHVINVFDQADNANLSDIVGVIIFDPFVIAAVVNPSFPNSLHYRQLIKNIMNP